ncbi:acetate--CoA ligase [Herbaspirillum sp. GCM10030257]|uniref:acetate--CoA ligase n=1 Tax=Herbaspirillum sp. GCM10030257 TaxID=3273393 RepID=UPI00362131F1
MSDIPAYPVPDQWSRRAWIDAETYRREYMRSIKYPDGFWKEHAGRLDWFKAPTKIRDCSFNPNDIHIRWFSDGRLNAAYNCVDRHLPQRSDQTAILWEGDEPCESRSLTYGELFAEVCRCANGLKELGVRKGDRVTIYMPMIPESVVAILACARIGAVHSVVFAGFSAGALASRIRDCESSVLVTADEVRRGGRRISLKSCVDEALVSCPSIRKCLVYQRHDGVPTSLAKGRDVAWHELMRRQSTVCPPEIMSAEDPLFILYTSGSTGAPKGAVHTTAGYLLFTSLTHQYVFDYHDGDVYWCTADIGWVTGHSYIIYGPLANGAITLMFEGIPSYPDASRFWQVCDKHAVNILYTAPTAIRALMQQGSDPVKRTSRQSLRLLGSVGEPINPEAWLWYYNVIGERRCPIVDTWWQTETGGIMIAPLPGVTALKPGSAAIPFFGVEPVLMDDNGHEVHGAGSGYLALRQLGPGMIRTLYGAHERFSTTYFAKYPGLYFTGDGARRDTDGDYWITGRIDDVINVSGHRLGTAELESALVAHPKVAEAAVVGFPHSIKGQGVYAFVTLNADASPSDALKEELKEWTRNQIGAIVSPDVIQWTPDLPKTRSGKIMRRILHKIAEGEYEDFGDISTLTDPDVLTQIVMQRKKLAGAHTINS